MWAPLLVLGGAGVLALADTLFSPSSKGSSSRRSPLLVTPRRTHRQHRTVADQLQIDALVSKSGGSQFARGPLLFKLLPQEGATVSFLVMPALRADDPTPTPKDYAFAAGVARALGVPTGQAPSREGMGPGQVFWRWIQPVEA